MRSMAQNRRDIGSHEIFAFTQTHHHRWSVAGRDNFVGIFTGDDGQRDYAGKLADGVPYGCFQIAGEIFFHQVGDDLGVGFSDEPVAFFGQLVLQREIIFDDAVMHHHDVAAAIAMGMRVFLSRSAMRGPAGVADAIGSVDRAEGKSVFQVAQLALGAADAQGAVRFQNGDAC